MTLGEETGEKTAGPNNQSIVTSTAGLMPQSLGKVSLTHTHRTIYVDILLLSPLG